MNLTVVCADVGSIANGQFGWAIRDLPSHLQEVPESASIKAVEAFCSALPQPETANRISEPRAFSLIGASLLRTGWSVPPSILSSACLVVAA